MKSEAFLMDCMEGMKNTPNKYYDLAVVDPPYGIGVNQMKMGGKKDSKTFKQKMGRLRS